MRIYKGKEYLATIKNNKDFVYSGTVEESFKESRYGFRGRYSIIVYKLSSGYWMNKRDYYIYEIFKDGTEKYL